MNGVKNADCTLFHKAWDEAARRDVWSCTQFPGVSWYSKKGAQPGTAGETASDTLTVRIFTRDAIAVDVGDMIAPGLVSAAVTSSADVLKMFPDTITTPRGSVTQIKNGNGAVTARLQWDPAFGARHTQSFLRTQAFIDSEVLRLMSPYTPLQTSMLIKSATLGTVIGSGKIKQIAPYAAWQYYRTDITRKYDPRRGAYWFERMKTDHRTYILKGAAEKAGAKYNE